MKSILNWCKKCKKRIILCIVSGIIVLLQLCFKNNYAVMNFLANRIIMPLHREMAELCDLFPFSAAGVILCLLTVSCICYFSVQLFCLIKYKNRVERLLSTLLTFASAGLGIYAGFCILWGVYYYGTDFIPESGLKNEPVSVEQLYEVTDYFAEILNEYGTMVSRDENGLYCADRLGILDKSNLVFSSIVADMPFLKGPEVRAKGFMFSRIMSILDFTGFFFPFTAEANVNTDFPPGLFAATVAHELSHQRGVAREQEANFTAVLACMKYGDIDYVYSGAMLAYTYLGNALYRANYELWEEIYSSLDENVMRDLIHNNDYWRQFDAPAKKVSNTVYEGFLQSYDQNLGLKSYGACVDLIVNYFYYEIQ